MRNRREKGIALITTLLILVLMSTMIVGLAWLVMGDQKLGGNNSDRQLAYYGAEAGMEQLTASLENAFDSNYALNSTEVNNILTTPGPPTNIPNVQYLAPGSTTNGSGYTITFTPSAANASLPASNFSTIPNGTYAGLVGLMTPYTLQVTAHTGYGSEVRLQREVQTVGIPVFQFGIFSQTDLSFFAGPNFNFGGRVHTNGNLWLAEGDGETLTMGSKVTAAGEIITSNLENGWPTNNNYTGAVDITTGSGLADLTQQTPPQSVTGTTNSFGNVGAYIGSTFGTMATNIYASNIAVGNTGATTLNLSIATPAIGGQPIDLIRRPVNGEDVAAPAKLSERYYSQTSMRILLSDYGPSGTCTDSDISSSSATKLPELSTNLANPVTPIDLATLAWDTVHAPVGDSNTKIPYYSAPAWITAASIGKTIFPLPVSYAQNAAYSGTDGYWVAQYYPIITGCIKIDYQTTAGGAWTDVTPTILNYGYTGRNIDPQVGTPTGNGTGKNIVPSYSLPTNGLQPSLAGISNQVAASGPTANAGIATVGCNDPSPGAIIRLARVRDNPSNGVTGNNWCGNNPSTGTWSGKASVATTCSATTNATNCPSQAGTDYWPNVIYDTREALLQDPTNPMNNNQAPLAGAMYYVELDAANLDAWLASMSASINNTTGYSVYFSDRRGEQNDPSPPASVGAAAALTGGFGYEDTVNFVNNVSAANGCPNGSLDPGEDDEGDYNSSGADTVPLLRTYGNILSTVSSGSNPTNPSTLWPIANNSIAGTPVTGTEIGGNVTAPAKAVYNLVNAALLANPKCGGPGKTWPFAIAFDTNDLRENPPIFFRRALKIVNGSTVSLGTCNSVACGLTIVSENPVYLQGDFNNPGLNTGFTGASVGASIVADAFTFLSDNWNDVNSFAYPYLSVTDNRVAADTTYRVAIAAGKGIPWLNSNGTIGQDFGTDGGTHNFLRYIEDWGNNNLWYEGSIVSMYYNHQAEGTYKCCNNVYNPPTRQYTFDSNFLTPSLLPPLTPMLRLVNTIGYTQLTLPTQ